MGIFLFIPVGHFRWQPEPGPFCFFAENVLKLALVCVLGVLSALAKLSDRALPLRECGAGVHLASLKLLPARSEIRIGGLGGGGEPSRIRRSEASLPAQTIIRKARRSASK